MEVLKNAMNLITAAARTVRRISFDSANHRSMIHKLWQPG